MSDGFQLVRSKRRKHTQKQNPHDHFQIVLNCVTAADVHRKLPVVINHFENSQFCSDLICGIKKVLKILGASNFDCLICYGLGQFTESVISLHQLAALVVLKKNFQPVVKVFDPLFNPTEIQVLEDLNFQIISKNEEGKRAVEENTRTLLFLPHCPKQLTNNFLWANWGNNIKNIVILNNSFSRIIDTNTKKSLLESASYIEKASHFTKEISLDYTIYEPKNAFNDLAIHYFSCDSHIFENQNTEPIYSEGSELINRFSNISIQNV